MTQYVINIGAIPNDGTGDPLRTAFNEVNLNFNQIWATGLVGSNLTIDNNTLLTTNTNGNLILNPNGVGVVQANAHVVPDRTRVRNLGAPNLLWDTAFIYYGNIVNANIGNASIANFGNLTVDVGNLHILGGSNGYVLQTDGEGNLTWTAQTGGGGNGVPGGANTQVQFNDSGAFGGSSGLTFNQDDGNLNVNSGFLNAAAVVTSGRIEAGTSISANGNIIAGDGAYFIGDGSLLTGIPVVNPNKIVNGNSYANIASSNGNLEININSNSWNYDTQGNLTVPSNTWINSPANSNANINLHPDGTGLVRITGGSGSLSGVLLNLTSDTANSLNRIEIDTYGSSNLLGGGLTGSFARGTKEVPTAVLATDRLAALKGRGFDGAFFTPPTGQITIDAYDNWTPGNSPTRLSFWTSGYSNLTPILNMQVNPNGNVDIFNGNLNVTGGYISGYDGVGTDALFAGIPGFTPLGTNVIAQFSGNANSYVQLNFQNINNGTQSSGDFIITANNGNDENNFIDLGIAGNNWNGSQPNSLGGEVEANDGYLYVNDGNLVLGTLAGGSKGNVIIAANGNTYGVWNFSTDGELYLPSEGYPALITTTGNGIQIQPKPATGGAQGGDIYLYAGNPDPAGSGVGANVNILATAGANSSPGGVVNITTPGGSWVFNANGNLSAGVNYINDLIDPFQPQDAATKYYVDSVAQGLHVHAAAYLGTTSDLATYTGATVTYNQPAGAGNGVGATLSFTGNTLTALDGVSLVGYGANTRLLIKNEANAVYNGVYTYTSDTVLTRATDSDIGGDFDGGDFIFVQAGNTQADTGWVQTTENVVIGTSNIVFTQFSGAGTGAQLTQSSSPPASPGADSLWYDTVSGRLYLYYNDGSSSNWIDASPAAVQLSYSAGNNLVLNNYQFSLANNISLTGNVTATAFIGDGSQLTGVANPTMGAAQITPPTPVTSSVTVPANASNVNITTDTISVTNSFVNGQAVTYNANGGTVMGGLGDGRIYYIGNVTGTSFQLYDNAKNALLGGTTGRKNITGLGNNLQTFGTSNTSIIVNYNSDGGNTVFVQSSTLNTVTTINGDFDTSITSGQALRIKLFIAGSTADTDFTATSVNGSPVTGFTLTNGIKRNTTTNINVTIVNFGGTFTIYNG